mmetsp:Transcript_11247/g.15768  ORF Transcript_11247/g.15768 Transcript_11247/m.15768 type:complete len:85 (-) Transcript_11247:37-291(-)
MQNTPQSSRLRPFNDWSGTIKQKILLRKLLFMEYLCLRLKASFISGRFFSSNNTSFDTSTKFCIKLSNQAWSQTFILYFRNNSF